MISELTNSCKDEIKSVTEKHNKDLKRNEQKIKTIKQNMLKIKEPLKRFVMQSRNNLKDLTDFYLNQKKIAMENFALNLEDQHKIFKILINKAQHEIDCLKLEIEVMKCNEKNLEEITQIKEIETIESSKRKNDQIEILNKKLSVLENNLINEKIKEGKEIDNMNTQLKEANEKFKQLESSIEEYKREISKIQKEKQELEQSYKLTINELKTQNQQLETKLMQQINDLIATKKLIEDNLNLEITEGEKKFKELQTNYNINKNNLDTLLENGNFKF